ncbi:hypothetical protein KRR38_33905 [Novosphingobium sp. G106]|uniref:hypothetical protein n=1 Tax=Novosphingobium sp. G106 TaxID=2849500 RepID=UPI001C2D5EAA|nr:hypothetical protein [Novosphingobium sp. G106]MBV1692497.1 hypothetical protein [Novosphingobium sp. G106]
MQVWCFVGANGLWALCGDEAGVSLPEELGPWTFLKVASLDGTEKDELEAKALITEHGFCCFDPSTVS